MKHLVNKLVLLEQDINELNTQLLKKRQEYNKAEKELYYMMIYSKQNKVDGKAKYAIPKSTPVISIIDHAAFIDYVSKNNYIELVKSNTVNDSECVKAIRSGKCIPGIEVFYKKGIKLMEW